MQFGCRNPLAIPAKRGGYVAVYTSDISSYNFSSQWLSFALFCQMLLIIYAYLYFFTEVLWMTKAEKSFLEYLV